MLNCANLGITFMNKSTTISFKRAVTSSALIAAAVMMVISTPLTAYADQYDDQINALEAEMNRFQAEAGRLRGEADSLQNAINAINAEKAAIQANIQVSEAKIAQLRSEIQTTEIKLNKQKDFLGRALAKMYVESSVSELEMMASSKSLGDFMDKQEYRTAVQNKIQSSIKEVKTLKTKLDKQKKEAEIVLQDQQKQREALVAKEAEQAQLLAQTQGQEANYRELAASRSAEMSRVRAEQAAAYAAYTRRSGISIRAGDPSRGGYPSVWANAPLDSLVDNWGMYNRECVSYAAYKVAASGRHMPYWGGVGNAYEWPGNARGAGIPVGSTPRVGSVAVWGIEDIGGVGHVAYVEGVNGDGSVEVSQYNYGVSGAYSTMTVPAGQARALEYIYF